MSLLPPRVKHDDPVETPTQVSVMLQIAELLKTIQDNSNQAAQQQALLQAEMLVRAMPENKEHPGISAYSYPEGDRARPKAALKCDFFWVGYPETPETLTPGEIDALNMLQPGEYQVTKANAERIKFTVSAKYKTDGRLESMSINFPIKDDQRHDHRSKTDYCYEAMGKPLPTLNDLTAEIERLKKELAGVAA